MKKALKKKLLKRSLLVSLSALAIFAGGCSSKTQGDAAGKASNDKITIAWLPNESGADLEGTRTEIGKMIEEATGKKVVNKTTTDYTIAIEAVANGSADMAFLGGEGYVEAHKKNKDVLPLVVNSGPSGTLDDAIYNSWLSVKEGNEGQYKDGDKFSIDNVAGKKFSFVSNSSTSGFKVPTTGILSHFSKQSKYKNLKVDDLIEGGKFFSEVLYGGSHQGSAVNLLTGKADVAAFCDTCVANYVELADGKKNTPGAIYKVKNGAAEPFNTLSGAEFTVISVTPVLNSPFVVNTENINSDEKQKILDAFTSDKMTGDEKIFAPEGSKTSALFTKVSGKEHLLPVDDAWFNPIRELSK
ncbi:phosphonate ABC transporter substrate-binding protein [Bacillus sp. MUM 116]|uniref:phosphate/phosphite/phosphonate ABC transporter substrate-binding protein n=1 Tax=Bacillus sp. MUM 116 TaxID=1678002 RepID=UPI0008F57B59|nr:phosphate/phosphite/phosphonate ABC transporter substrate-binding protein [Bacillus sp. MUM 116]OIK15133.1 phosphonate ABC transporter substrate-binding protein [Bacillus sp. MUM 116]